MFFWTLGGGECQLNNNYDGILTKTQLVLLLESVMNCDLYYKYFFKLYPQKIPKEDEDSEEYIKRYKFKYNKFLKENKEEKSDKTYSTFHAIELNQEYTIAKLINRLLVSNTEILKEIKIEHIDFTKIKNLGILSRYYNFNFIQQLQKSYKQN